MSDQSSPPKPKPGSLRDRIAAFENKGSTATPLGPPPPRPKPANLQWKPKPPSPPTSPDLVQSDEHKSQGTGGMSAADAMESIGRAGSLKERMAALQGKGAFGGPPPPIAPKPTVDRPKWKPPPAVPASAPTDGDSKDSADVSGREASRSPPPRVASSPAPENQGELSRDDETVLPEVDNGDPDLEEDERQRRAAIAARMARLGGARFGMGPPIFAPKPAVRKPQSSSPAPEVKDEIHGDQPTVVKDTNEDSVTPSHDLPAAVSSIPKVITDAGCKDDDPESPPPVPSRAPVSMPVPVGPRRPAPPRKKGSKNAPAAALPEPPTEDMEGVTPSVPNDPLTTLTSVDLPAHDASLIPEGIGEVMPAVEATHERNLDVPADAEQHPTVRPSEPFQHPVEEEPAKQEAEEEHVEHAGSHVKDHTTAADDQVTESGERGEARSQRVATKLTQMGAFNPLAEPPPIPSRQSLEEPALAATEAPQDVEGEVNVDTEEHRETVPSPPAVSPRRGAVQATKQDAAESHVEIGRDQVRVGEDSQAPAHCDGERAVVACAEEPGDGHEKHTLPSAVSFETQPDSAHTARQERGTTSTQGSNVYDVSGTTPFGADVQLERLQSDSDGGRLTRTQITEVEHDGSKEAKTSGELPPLRITRPIPPPPPVNLRSKPTPPSSPPLSSPPKAPQQALRVDEVVECPPSPDTPPRPVPPPGRSASMMEDMTSFPTRRSMPPPPRHASMPLREADKPFAPPPAPTSPRPIGRRPETPQIITTLIGQEQEQEAPQHHEQERESVAEEDVSENATPRADDLEDDASARRRAIVERMAKLGGIRFGAPPPMNPLSRSPLPAAPPPTSIPPDEMEEEGPREEEDEDESMRKQRIAAKLAGMGGMRLGMLPPAAGLPPVSSARRPVAKQEDSESEDTVPPVPVPAPPQRPPPTRKPPPPVGVPVDQEPDSAGGRESRGMSDDGVRVEAEESEIEEVRYSDAEVEALPPPRRSTSSGEALPTLPRRMTSRSPPPGRPPIPMIPVSLLGRRPSATARSASVSSSRQASLDGEAPTMSGRASEGAVRASSEYVMVEAVDPNEDDSPAPTSTSPRRKSTRRIPVLPPVPPPSAIDPPEVLSSSAQWELPSIPQGTAEFGEGSEMMMSSSAWSEDSTAVHAPGAALSSSQSPSSTHTGSRSTSGKGVLPSSTTSVSISTGSGSGRKSLDQQQQLTTDALMAISNRTGARVVESATALFEKSKRALVGDGSHAGFVRAVLAQVPGLACPPGGGGDDEHEWGYVVYAQTGNAVQRRVSDILPGDVIAFWDAKLKGHKGLQTYTQTVGVEGGGPLVGIVSEFDARKSKVRVWQANQHVGQQTVEIVSYRLEDLKTGQVKVYRVLEA